MTVVAYAVGAVLVLAAVIREPSSTGTLLPLVVAAATLAIVAVALLFQRRANLQRTIAEIRRAESVVAAGLIEAPRADVAELIAELRRVGFEIAGATDTRVGRGAPIRTWVLTDGGGRATTWVEVGIARTPIAIFLSRAADGRFLETSFPDGATIDVPYLLARPIGATVKEALGGHRATLDEWTSRAGAPLVVRTLNEYRRVETELRERTGGMRIAAYIERAVEPGLRHWAISAIIGVVTFLALVLMPGR